MTAEILPGIKKADPETVQRLRIASFHVEEGLRRLAIVAGILLAACSAYPMMGQWAEFPDSFFSLLLWPAAGYLGGWLSMRLFGAALIWITKGFVLGPD
jgi:hypothetical protein